MYIQADENGVKTTTTEKKWRLVHNGVQVMVLEEQDFITTTGSNTEIFIADTKEACEAEVTRLKLIKPEHIK